MDDDFNTALAISQLFGLSKDINIYYQEVMNKGVDYDAAGFARVSEIYLEMASIIGIFEQEEAAADDGLTDKLMELIIGIRQDARKEKNWAIADKIRDELKEVGIVIEDTPNGARWKKA
jgi:cysteinyl-tRNA synthetase